MESGDFLHKKCKNVQLNKCLRLWEISFTFFLVGKNKEKIANDENGIGIERMENVRLHSRQIHFKETGTFTCVRKIRHICVYNCV